jgi:TonB family protein
MPSPRKIGRYEILRELGRGAMGVVFKARDPHIGRLVALKTITAGVAEDPDLMERFYQEAKTAGALQHPNVVTIYEMAEADGAPFIAMEYLEGESLDQLIARRAPLPVAQKLGFIVQACHALDYAHERGIIHRDIKPANIMLTRDGIVKVVDFGIARLADTSKTQTGTVLGTFAYMSPQQFQGRHADAQSDVWSIGVVLYELLACRKPFAGDHHASLLMSILQDDPPPLQSLLPECPAPVEEIVRKALRKDISERYSSMEALLLELEPVWTSERDKTAGRLVQNAREMLLAQRFSEAREELQQCLSVDRSNLTAKSLLEEVNMVLGAGALPGRIAEHVSKGKSLLAEGLFAEAREQAEIALRLDPRDAAARNLLESVDAQQGLARQEQARHRQYVDQQMRTMRASIERGDLSNAIDLGKVTLARVGADQGLSQLVRFAERERQAREAKAGADQRVHRIVALLQKAEFAEAQKEVQALQDAAPLDPRIPSLSAAAVDRRALSPSSASALFELNVPAQDAGREYVLHSGSSGSGKKTSLSGDLAGATIRAPVPAATRVRTSQPDPRLTAPEPVANGEPARGRAQKMSSPANPPTAPRRQQKRVALYLGACAVVLATAGLWTYQHFFAGTKPAAPAASPSPAVVVAPPPKPDSPADQQLRLIDLAHEAADAGDYEAAQSRLDQAEKLNGPLRARIAELRGQFQKEVQDKGLQQVAKDERPIWDEAMKELSSNDLDKADQSFRRILALPEGGRRRSEAQHYVNEVIPARRQEDRLWARAGELAGSHDVAQIQESVRLLDNLAVGGGAHAEEAQRLRDRTNQQLAAIEGNKQSSDSNRERFAQLENDFRRAKQQGDSASLTQLREIQDGFRVIRQAGGPLAAGAADYESNVIPSMIKQIEDRQTAADALSRANAQFEDAANRYNQALAAKDSAALRSKILPAFQAIARSGGPKASEADRYVSSVIPEAIRNLTPWPAVGCAAMPQGLEQTVKPGELVACGLLDSPKLKWAQFSWPPFPTQARLAGLDKGVAMLSLTVDENGNVIDARPRGPKDAQGFTDAALSAAKEWKTTAPRAQGKPVRTQFSVDVSFAQ